MRILSQTGLHEGIIDVPYEQISIEQRGNEIWRGYYATLNKHCIGKCFAKYSTAEKAQKALDMLRKAYAGLPIIMQNVDITDDIAEMLKEWKKQGIVYRTENDEPSKIEVVNNGYFQFPSDDGIGA